MTYAEWKQKVLDNQDAWSAAYDAEATAETDDAIRFWQREQQRLELEEMHLDEMAPAEWLERIEAEM